MIETADTIAANVREVKKRIAEASARAKRDPKDIRLLAVSKNMPPEYIRHAAAGGQTLFGENYIQEAMRKISELAEMEPPCEFHFIGSMQRNKAREAVGMFSLIHTVDRPELADTLSEVAARKSVTQEILLQINVSQESTKSGIDPEHAQQLAEHVLVLPNLRLRGLMCIGKYFDADLPDEIRRSEFRAMFALRRELANKIGSELPELSMGMSHDFDLAVEEGATIVRVGTSIFGERS